MNLQALIPISLFIILNSLAADSSSNHTECGEKLAAHPIATVPPQKRCEAIAVAFNSTGSGDSCICHLLQQPHIFGFANVSSVLSLLSSCKTMPKLPGFNPSYSHPLQSVPSVSLTNDAGKLNSAPPARHPLMPISLIAGNPRPNANQPRSH
ncbi:hypothetical protein SLEP1_g49810 [Rubroshorea leprosula]|uniref:Bifunctional inhibitor/plant lipid transfer protein/seed storage helical domain-containing protein n=1 Tax=Rubroshorea leprosula TaxID=152421 RepID=A0AAV5M1A7_9ROSI|nr:hypothetical protein SLEP1_g49810 [Rubroshorea leprosula]